MTKLLLRRLRLLILLSGLLLIPAAGADELNPDEVLELRRAGALLPLEQLLSEVQRRYPQARVLEVELDRENTRYLYEIEILTATDTVRELEFDAVSGALLDDELED
jgi:uncharacterized membrane protein YkoI